MAEQPEAPAAPVPLAVAGPQADAALAQEPAPSLRSLASPAILAPVPAGEPGEGAQMLTVVLRSTGDKTRDVLRLRRIHGIISSYPGNDRFAFHVFERGRGYLLEFPNDSAGINPELVQRLSSLIGSENVRIEPITFQ